MAGDDVPAFGIAAGISAVMMAAIWVSIDDDEAHYLKVIGDEIFGRRNFILDIVWEKRDGPPNDRKIASIHDHVLVWANGRVGDCKKTRAEEVFNLMPRTEKADAQLSNPRNDEGRDPRGPFRKIDTTANGKGGRYVESLFYAVKNPYTGEDVWPRKGTCWRITTKKRCNGFKTIIGFIGA